MKLGFQPSAAGFSKISTMGQGLQSSQQKLLTTLAKAVGEGKIDKDQAAEILKDVVSGKLSQSDSDLLSKLSEGTDTAAAAGADPLAMASGIDASQGADPLAPSTDNKPNQLGGIF